jgi:hypothetical protein
LGGCWRGSDSGCLIDRSREGHGSEADKSKEDGLCEMHVDILVGRVKDCDMILII